VTTGAPRPIPGPGPLPGLTPVRTTDEQLPNGLRVVVLRMTHIPLVQLHLAVPLGDVTKRDAPALRLLPKMLLAGTRARTGSELATAIQRLGATVDVSASVDYLSFSCSAPAARLHEIFELLGEIVAQPAFAKAEIIGERERVVQDLSQEAADPASTATRALLAELYPQDHPYAGALPGVPAVRRVGRTALTRLHEARVRPTGSSIVVVGDVDPEDVLGAASRVLGGWSPAGTEPPVGELARPRLPSVKDRIHVVHRPGAVQSNLRVGVRCQGRHDPTFPALALATTILGGSFMSRLVANLRERNGYTYSPRAAVTERRRAAAMTVSADVATDVTGKALVELRYELAQMATSPASLDELEDARRYMMGTLTMTAATQAGMCGLLASLVMDDLPPSYLEGLLREFAMLDVEAVWRAASSSLGPGHMTTVVLGDAEVIAELVSPLGEVELSVQ
jgi:zinc protease